MEMTTIKRRLEMCEEGKPIFIPNPGLISFKKGICDLCGHETWVLKTRGVFSQLCGYCLLDVIIGPPGDGDIPDEFIEDIKLFLKDHKKFKEKLERLEKK